MTPVGKLEPIKATDEATAHSLFVRLNDMIDTINELTEASVQLAELSSKQLDLNLEIDALRAKVRTLTERVDQLS